jgi:hypothetical protein
MRVRDRAYAAHARHTPRQINTRVRCNFYGVCFIRQNSFAQLEYSFIMAPAHWHLPVARTVEILPSPTTFAPILQHVWQKSFSWDN